MLVQSYLSSNCSLILSDSSCISRQLISYSSSFIIRVRREVDDPTNKVLLVINKIVKTAVFGAARNKLTYLILI